MCLPLMALLRELIIFLTTLVIEWVIFKEAVALCEAYSQELHSFIKWILESMCFLPGTILAIVLDKTYALFDGEKR